MKYVIVYDKYNERDMILCGCILWEKEEDKHDIRFISPSIFINHNAVVGLNDTILSGSDTWEIYVQELLIKEFNNVKDVATYYFNFIIKEGYDYAKEIGK